MKQQIVVFLFSISLLTAKAASAEKLWQPSNSGISDLDLRSIAVFAQDDNLICAASADSAYLSQNRGKLWQNFFSVQAEDGEINFVAFDRLDPNKIYIATTEGIFATENRGEVWQRIFRRVNQEAKDVGWVAIDALDCRRIYLGTGRGLYLSGDSGQSWQRVSGGLPHSAVRSIAAHPANSQVLYLANSYGLFKSQDGAQLWKRIFVTSYKASDEDQELTEAEQGQNLINCIAIDQNDPRKIYLATSAGVFVSQDAGGVWSELSAQGYDYVNFVVVAPSEDAAVYAATKNGVFEFSPQLSNWRQLYQGMTAVEVRSLAINSDGTQLFAATDKGVFKTINTTFAQGETTMQQQGRPSGEPNLDHLLSELSLNEPSIQEVQEAALRYAEVIHPDQIRALRQHARIKALLPDVSVDYDKTIQAGGTGSNFGNFVVGPRDWSLSFSWDIGDLVFSEQLRLIDSNVRLAVQLRDDIINEVTRIYYERRKLQTELALAPPETSREEITQRLRLEELSANIDALTGGYFSRELEKRSSKNVRRKRG